MTYEETNIKCPVCGKPLVFDRKGGLFANGAIVDMYRCPNCHEEYITIEDQKKRKLNSNYIDLNEVERLDDKIVREYFDCLEKEQEEKKYKAWVEKHGEDLEYLMRYLRENFVSNN